ncbi:hypothetical protein GCM10010520_11360 [Rhizobium viscosum]
MPKPIEAVNDHEDRQAGRRGNRRTAQERRPVAKRTVARRCARRKGYAYAATLDVPEPLRNKRLAARIGRGDQYGRS